MKKNKILLLVANYCIFTNNDRVWKKVIKEKEKGVNTNTGITKEQIVGDLTISKTALVYENGTSKLTT